MNAALILLMYLIGLSVDWILQTNWQATYKSGWGKHDLSTNKKRNLTALLSHSAIYAIATSFIVLILLNLINYFWLVCSILFITHSLIDTRIPVKWIMKYIKRMSDEQIYDYDKFGFIHIGIDHRLHELVIVALGFLIH